MPKSLTSLAAREILDSRGNPTLEVIAMSHGHRAACQVPSGASRGTYEALELRDNDTNRFNGLGVLHAIHNISSIISPAIMGAQLDSQQAIDSVLIELDGTENKSRLGANAILGVSIACAKLQAKLHDKPFHAFISDHFQPKPSPFPGQIKLFANLINGGAHAVGSTSVQEFQIIPQHDTLEDNLLVIKRFQDKLKEALHQRHQSAVGVGDEGGFTLANHTTNQVLDLLHDIKAEMQLGGKIAFGLDVAANELYSGDHYHLDGQRLQPGMYEKLMGDIIHDYHIFAVEDPFIETSFEAYRDLKEKHPDTIVVGDDLTVTNPDRLQKAIDTKSIGAIIIKPNQIGTLSETMNVISLAHSNSIRCIASHRSGETNDDFIVDIAWAANCFGAKLGALQRGERIAKYNRLLALSKHDA